MNSSVIKCRIIKFAALLACSLALPITVAGTAAAQPIPNVGVAVPNSGGGGGGGTTSLTIDSTPITGGTNGDLLSISAGKLHDSGLAVANVCLTTTCLPLSGGTLTGPLQVPAGTVAAPGIAVGPANYGLYQPGTNQLGITVNGVDQLDFGSTNAGKWTFGSPIASPTFSGTAAMPDSATWTSSGIASLTGLGLTSGASLNWNADTYLTRGAAATLQLGQAASATPVAQTLRAQGGSGTNIAGVNWTFVGSLSTGTGNDGDVIFQTGVKNGVSGTGAATATTALALKGETQQVQVASAGSAAIPALSVGVAGTGLYSVSTTGLCFADVNGSCKADYGVANAGDVTVAAALVNSTGGIVSGGANSLGGVGTIYAGGTGTSSPIVGVTNSSGQNMVLMAVGTFNPTSGLSMVSGGNIQWNVNAAGTGGAWDTGVFRSAGGVVGIDNGAATGLAATFREAKLRSVVIGGAAPTNSGTCAVTSQTGGNTAGTFTASGACAGGTYIFAFAFSAPTGWACDARDQTTPADTVNQTASSLTSATFTATTANNDVVGFKCMAY